MPASRVGKGGLVTGIHPVVAGLPRARGDEEAPLRERLNAQQSSLVKAVSQGNPDFLNRSYYPDPATGQRTAMPLDGQELKRFTSRWGVAPIGCIRSINAAIAQLEDRSRVPRYVKAAVDLEILMDAEVAKADSKVDYGIPSYLPSGYTYVEPSDSTEQQPEHEAVQVDKEILREQLIDARLMALELGPSLGLLESYYPAVRRELAVDQAGAEERSSEDEDGGIGPSDDVESIGPRLNLSLLHQLFLQEAGLQSRVVKGEVRSSDLSEPHAWSLVWLAGEVLLVDVSLPASGGEPFILLGASIEDVYREAKSHQRGYRPAA